MANTKQPRRSQGLTTHFAFRSQAASKSLCSSKPMYERGRHPPNNRVAGLTARPLSHTYKTWKARKITSTLPPRHIMFLAACCRSQKPSSLKSVHWLTHKPCRASGKIPAYTIGCAGRKPGKASPNFSPPGRLLAKARRMRTEKPCEFIGLLTQALYREAKSQSRQSHVKQLHVSYGFAIKRDILSYTLEAAGRWPGANAAITKSGSVMLFLTKCVGNYTHAWISLQATNQNNLFKARRSCNPHVSYPTSHLAPGFPMIFWYFLD